MTKLPRIEVWNIDPQEPHVYQAARIANEPRFSDPNFRVTHEYTMELTGVPQ